MSVDGQRDGKLNKTEFQEGIRRLGITLSETDAGALFEGLPRTPDGLIDYNGFSNYLRERSVKQHQVGQVRSTNYSKSDARTHVVQQRVADAVALKRKDLEIVFREKDQGRGPKLRSQVGLWLDTKPISIGMVANGREFRYCIVLSPLHPSQCRYH